MEKEKLVACKQEQPSEPIIQEEFINHNIGEEFMDWAEKYWALETLVIAGLNANAGGESCPYKCVRDTFIRKINELTEKKKILKLYYFNPNDWGAQYFVMASSKANAYKNLIEYFQKKVNNPNESYIDYYIEELKRWEKVNPEDLNTFPKGAPDKYTLDEFEEGQVYESENA